MFFPESFPHLGFGLSIRARNIPLLFQNTKDPATMMEILKLIQNSDVINDSQQLNYTISFSAKRQLYYEIMKNSIYYIYPGQKQIFNSDNIYKVQTTIGSNSQSSKVESYDLTDETARDWKTSFQSLFTGFVLDESWEYFFIYSPLITVSFFSDIETSKRQSEQQSNMRMICAALTPSNSILDERIHASGLDEICVRTSNGYFITKGRSTTSKLYEIILNFNWPNGMLPYLISSHRFPFLYSSLRQLDIHMDRQHQNTMNIKQINGKEMIQDPDINNDLNPKKEIDTKQEQDDGNDYNNQNIENNEDENLMVQDLDKIVERREKQTKSELNTDYDQNEKLPKSNQINQTSKSNHSIEDQLLRIEGPITPDKLQILTSLFFNYCGRNILMDCVSEYNVVESMLGLGEYILLEIISEMIFPQDVQQFLVEAWQGRSDKNKFISSTLNKPCTIAIDPIISEGIVKIEFIFKNTSRQSKSMGIADASCSFAVGKGPSEDGNKKKTVRYFWDGELDHITNITHGSGSYEDGQRISAIVDMTSNPRKVVFYVDDIEQPNYVIKIPSEIRFWACTYGISSSFKVTKFQRLIQFTSQRDAGSKALKWGKSWE